MPPVRRLALVWAAALAVLLATAPGAPAATFKRCRGGADVDCARVVVPLDRTGTVPGKLALRVERVRARRVRRGAVVALAGGPGQAATLFTRELARDLSAASATRDVIVFDQRGTGRSGLLRCGPLQRANPLRAGRQAALCAQTLGPRRGAYTTRESVEDIEAIRQLTGRERISLYGISYGTKVAEAYALRYPQHVERLVLDSVVLPEGPDALYGGTIGASARVLRDLCAGVCRQVTPDVVGDTAALAGKMAGGSLEGHVVGSDGRRRPAALDAFGLLATLVSGDFDQTLRAAYPGAVRAALAGDMAPILRLKKRSEALEQPGDVRELSAALNAATLCEETELPWERTAPPQDRRRQAAERAAGYPDSAFFPFGRAAALGSDLINLCALWPARPEPPALAAGPFSAVPALILSGEEDLRTPLEDARALAQRMPGAQLVPVSETGHSVVSADLTGCVDKALRLFFAGRDAAGRCLGDRLADPTPPPPRSLGQVRPPRKLGGRVGRTASTVLLTIADAFDSSLSVAEAGAEVVRAGGLRGGSFRLAISGEDGDPDRLLLKLRLERVEYVPGVEVTGTIRSRGFDTARGRLRVGGRAAARGRLTFRSNGSYERLSGRLGDRRVRLRRRLPQIELARSGGAAEAATVQRALDLARRRLSRPRLAGIR
jgi:pimeloyl-ACP methyl ester carboxylesterase